MSHKSRKQLVLAMPQLIPTGGTGAVPGVGGSSGLESLLPTIQASNDASIRSAQAAQQVANQLDMNAIRTGFLQKAFNDQAGLYAITPNIQPTNFNITGGSNAAG
jgi:hypothetical protein